MPTPISVVIPCKDDLAVLDCIRSMDAPAHVVLVFNGSSSHFIDHVLRGVAGAPVQHLILPRANLSMALEEGIRAAPSDWVLLMDSDCEFAPGCIRSFVERMSEGDPSREVYKGNVVFKHGADLISRVIARSRQHHTAEQLTAYKPPLALSRSIAPKVGGHVFNPRLHWREDADLDHRIRAAGLDILPVQGVVYHGRLTLRGDLRSTFRYGVGEAMADDLGLQLTDVPRSVLSTYRSQGALPAAYMAVRNRVHTCGYWYTRARRLLSS